MTKPRAVKTSNRVIELLLQAQADEFSQFVEEVEEASAVEFGRKWDEIYPDMMKELEPLSLNSTDPEIIDRIVSVWKEQYQDTMQISVKTKILELVDKYYGK